VLNDYLLYLNGFNIRNIINIKNTIQHNFRALYSKYESSMDVLCHVLVSSKIITHVNITIFNIVMFTCVIIVTSHS